MKKVSHLAITVALSLGLVACGSSGLFNSATEKSQSNLVSGIDKANFDTAIRPQDDFYYSVNGHWLATHPVPADKSNYGAFSVLYEQSQAALKDIIEKAAAKKHVAAGSVEQKVGDFYKSYMNTSLIESMGVMPLKSLLKQIDMAKDHDAVAGMMGELLINGVTMPISFYVSNDAKNSTQNAVYLAQSGLTLPDRDYYLKDTKKFKKNRAELKQYVEDIMAQAGYVYSKRASESVSKIETFIAKSQWSRVESRDAHKTYNKMSAKQLNTKLADFDFPQFSKAVGFSQAKEMIVEQPSYFADLGKQFDSFSVEEWKDYMAFHLVDAYAELLSKNFVNLHFDFHGKTLMGIEVQKPRWKKAVDAEDEVLGELVGQEYVAKYFKPEAKAKMEVMIQNLIKGFEVSINELEWMTPATKVAAQEKLSKFTYKIGYPDKWKDYSKLTIKADDLVGNYERYAKFEYAKMIDKLGKPIDRTEWHMTPQTVNAYYNPVMNEIVFPAAILQPPFFDMKADDAVNYGGIGAVIGHEISHGFDDQGAKYDGDGNLRDWWSDKDREEFKKRAAKLAAQYSKYEALPGEFVNGELTLGENIGDLGGLTVAERSYRLSLKGEPSPVIDGLTGEQRLFMGWSQVWRRNYRDEELKRRLLVDPHSPSHFRAMGTPRNIPAFYQAFDVQPSDKMYLPQDQRVKIW
ncbi:M13-type metalloendopeptidase [uncultured Shewanella sp.]|uniref:M13 family metallopeptidase n=1 Tax=uncultured Shewanella sp. TaxID=173975 RepID=UPI00262F7136|nr:M13-type metalloendopeptidase [uncultured Shewanella sp.]